MPSYIFETKILLISIHLCSYLGRDFAYCTIASRLLLKGPEFCSNNKHRGFCLEGGFVHMIGGILSILQNLRGGFCPPFHKLQGVLCPPCKKHEGCFVHLCQNEQGVFCPGGVLSYIQKTFTRTEQLYFLGYNRSCGRGWDPVKPV